MGRFAALLIVVLLAGCSTDGDTPDASAKTTPAPPPSAQSTAGAPSAEPATPAPPTGTAPSKDYAVKKRQIELSRGKDRPLPTTVWYPGTGDGPFPVIVFSHGLTSEPSAYRELLESWARAGFVVAAPAFPHTSYGVADFDVLDLVNQPADASYVLSQVLARGRKAGDSLEGRLDPVMVAAAGHSGGGITTIGMLSGNRDDRLRAAVVLSGRQVLPVPFAGPELPVLFVHGKLDKTVRYADGLAAYRAVPWPKAMLALPLGGHLPASGGDFAQVAAATTDFWRWSLYGDPAAKQRLADQKNLTDEL